MQRKLYRAAIAAADGALRLHDTNSAKQWLAEAPAELRGWEWRYLRRLSDESWQERQAHDGPITGLAVDAQGRWLASTSGDKTVKLWDLATGKERVTLPGAEAVWSVAFSPDGRLLASAGGSITNAPGELRVWDIEKPRGPQ